jgi:hypothetical protein
MSITISTYPDNIDNKAAYTVDTDLIEDSTHINLRIRASIYHEGIIKAIVEKPKGLTGFDFADILKSLTPGLKFARDGGLIVNTGTAGTNLITDVTGSYTTFTKTANVINSAITASSGSGNSTPAISLVAGHLYVFYILNYVNNLGSGYEPIITFSDWTTIPLCPELIQIPFAPTQNNKSTLLMCVQSGNIAVNFTNPTAANWSGELYLKDITTDRETIGNPLCPYYPLFTEVWETALGVTTLGANSVSSSIIGCKRFVPAKGDPYLWPYFGTTFQNYVLSTGYSQLFANKTLRNNITKFYTVNPYEYWVVFFTEYVSLEFFYSKNGGAYDHATHPYCYEGWGAIVLNVGELMSSVTSTLAFYLKEISTAALISETLTVRVDGSCNDAREVLEFDGETGGKEYLAFDGLLDVQYDTIRQYYTGEKRGKKPLLLTGINRQKLETIFKDIYNSAYLKGLLVSEVVKKLNLSYAVPTDVTIVSNSVKIRNSELFTNQIEIESEDD